MSKFTNILAALLLMVAISCNGNVAENITGTNKSKPSTEKKQAYGEMARAALAKAKELFSAENYVTQMEHWYQQLRN